MLFVTISPIESDFDQVLSYVNDRLQKDKLVPFIVRENGKNGNHPHIHYIVTSNSRGCDYVRKVRSWFLKHGVDAKPSYFIRTRAVTNLEGILIYLSKEDNKEVLKNTIDFDESKLKKKGEFKYERWRFLPSFIDFPLFAKAYCEANELKYQEQVTNLTGLFDKMMKDGIGVHHLYRRQEELERACSSLC